MKNGVYDMDSDIPATITSHEPGYLIKEEEKLSVYKQMYH